MSKSRGLGSTPAHPIPWSSEENQIARTCARGLVRGQLMSEGAAVRECAAALARAGFAGRRTHEAIRYKIRDESARMGRQPSRKHWTPAEERVIDRFARAVVRHRYRDATAAARDCGDALARLDLPYYRTPLTIAARIGRRALKYGRKKIRVIWTPEENRLLKELAWKVSSGTFREVRDASRSFVAEMNRRRKGWARWERPIPVRTLDAVDRKLWHVARDIGLSWGFRDWSREENEVVDRFIRQYASGRHRTLRGAALACWATLGRLRATRRTGPGHLRARSLVAVQQHLSDRAISRGVPRPLYRRWSRAEQLIAARHAGRFVTDSGRHQQATYIIALQRELRGLGHERTLTACGSEFRRALLRSTSHRQRPGLLSPKTPPRRPRKPLALLR